MTILEKVAYLRGLSEGLGIDETSKEGRVFKAIIDVLDDISLTVTDLEDDVAELSDGLDEIDEDLGALEEEFYGDECDDECGCDCGCEDEECDDDELYEVTCPAAAIVFISTRKCWTRVLSTVRTVTRNLNLTLSATIVMIAAAKTAIADHRINEI